MDHNSTTNIRPSALATMVELLPQSLNASAVHDYGRRAKMMLVQARDDILKALNAPSDYDLVFTSSGTEANNLVLNRSSCVLISAVEHLSIYQHWKQRQRDIEIIKVDKQGFVDLCYLRQLIEEKMPTLISVIMANNETGIISNLSPVIAIAKEYGVQVHSDASQALGKIPLDIKALNIDYLTISAHKFGGPVGIAALIYRRNSYLNPQIIGGGQEKGIRAGTEAVPLAAAFALAAKEAIIELDSYQDHISKLRTSLEQGLHQYCPTWSVVGSSLPRLPNTSLLLMHTSNPKANLINLELKGFALSSGSACSSGKVGASHVLQAMDYSQELASSAVRISLGMQNTPAEVEQLLAVLKELYSKRK